MSDNTTTNADAVTCVHCGTIVCAENLTETSAGLAGSTSRRAWRIYLAPGLADPPRAGLAGIFFAQSVKSS